MQSRPQLLVGRLAVKAHVQSAMVGAFTGPASAPRPLPLGRYNTGGPLRYVGRRTALPQTAGRAIAELLTPTGDDRPWTG